MRPTNGIGGSPRYRPRRYSSSQLRDTGPDSGDDTSVAAPKCNGHGVEQALSLMHGYVAKDSMATRGPQEARGLGSGAPKRGSARCGLPPPDKTVRPVYRSPRRMRPGGEERVEAIEHTLERHIPRSDRLRFETRELDERRVTIRDPQLRHSLRNRPDHIVAGEARGADDPSPGCVGNGHADRHRGGEIGGQRDHRHERRRARSRAGLRRGLR